jgi:hypothetical protein
MGSLSDYAESVLLKHLCLQTAYSPAATLYLALCTADPTDGATGASMSEVANSGNYSRTAITFGAAASRRSTQNALVTFPLANGSWGTVSYWAIVDSGTYGAGNVLASGAFTVAKSIVSGNTPSVASSEVYVEITASTGLSTYAANGFLDRMFRNQAFTVSNNYVALVTSTPTDAAGGTEVAGGSYARAQINAFGGASPAWTTNVANTATTNGAAVTFPSATASWGTITYMQIMDAVSTGNVLWYGAITSQLVGIGDTVTFLTNQISVNQT